MRPKFKSLSNAKGIVDVFMENPKKYGVALTLAQEVLREASHLSPLNREIIAAYTSKLNECEYCCGSHTEFVKSLDGNQQDVDAITNAGVFLGHRLDAIFKYITVLTKNPSQVTDELKNEVLAAGFSEEELKDAIAVCAAFNFYNRIVEGHGVDANPETWESASTAINMSGYDRRYFK
jgi:uncharacterized peroxidase-related enzyme